MLSVYDLKTTPTILNTNMAHNTYNGYTGGYIQLPISGKDVLSGNNLSYSITPNVTDITAETRLFEEITIDFQGDEGIVDDKNISTVIFDNKIAIKQDSTKNRIYFYSCYKLADPSTLKKACKYISFVDNAISVTDELQDDVNYFDGYIALWTKDTKNSKTKIFIFSIQSGSAII